MKLKYTSDADLLNIGRSGHAASRAHEIPGAGVPDYDVSAPLVGIDIDHASRKVRLIMFDHSSGRRRLSQCSAHPRCYTS